MTAPAKMLRSTTRRVWGQHAKYNMFNVYFAKVCTLRSSQHEQIAIVSWNLGTGRSASLRSNCFRDAARISLVLQSRFECYHHEAVFTSINFSFSTHLQKLIVYHTYKYLWLYNPRIAIYYEKVLRKRRRSQVQTD